MVYGLRKRKNRNDPPQPSVDNSDEETANDSRHSDPDYERPRRQTQPGPYPVRRAASLTGETGLTEVGEGNSSSTNANSVQRRRPPKRGVLVEQNFERNVTRRQRSRPVNREPANKMKAIRKGNWLFPFCVYKYCDGGGELLDCTHCEKKYHWKCFMAWKELDLNSKDCSSFCGRDCREVYGELQAMVGVSQDVGNGISWTLLQKRDVPDYISDDERIHRREMNSKIAVAWSLLKEIFVTNMDRHKCNSTRVNFGGFYVAVLEKDKIISAATVRVHGRSLAEMPFIGIQECYRKQGMSRKLLDRIESTLCSLKIPNLIIPSPPELVDLWTDKYSFSPMEDDFIEELMNFNALEFPSKVRLRKKLHPKKASVNQEGNASVPALPDLNLDPSEEIGGVRDANMTPQSYSDDQEVKEVKEGCHPRFLK